MKYRYHVFSSLMGYSPTKMTLVIDGKEIKHEVFSAALGIAQYNGGGMKQLPFAVPDDGVFDLTIIRKITRLKVISSVTNSTMVLSLNCLKFQPIQARVSLSNRIPNARLKRMGKLWGESPFRFEILPQALNVIIT